MNIAGSILFVQGLTVSSISAGIFAALDLRRHAGTRITGREPLFVSALLLRTDAGEREPTSLTVPTPDDAYNLWLDRMLVESGIPTQEIEEAWYYLLQYPIARFEHAETELQRFIAKRLIAHVIVAVPTHVTEYLLSTDIGRLLQTEFELQVEAYIEFHATNDQDQAVVLQHSAQEWERDYQAALDTYIQHPTTTVSAGVVTLTINVSDPDSMLGIAHAEPSAWFSQYPNAVTEHSAISLLSKFTHEDVAVRAGLWHIGLRSLERHGLAVDEWHARKDALLRPDETGRKAGVAMRTYLLEQWPVARQHFVDATHIGEVSILQLLQYITPAVVRHWLAMPALSWSEAQPLLDWAQRIFSIAAPGHIAVNLRHELLLYGHSLFPDAVVVREHILTITEDLVDGEYRAAVQQLLALAAQESSLALKANLALTLNALLIRPVDDSVRHDMVASLQSLIATVCNGPTGGTARQAALGTLEVLLCRWLYHTWTNGTFEQDKRNEFAYLAAVGAGVIVDALAVEASVSVDVASSLADELRDRLQPSALGRVVEPHPDGWFRPASSGRIMYRAAYLLQNLAYSTGLADPGIVTDPVVRATLLKCGAQQRLEQALLALPIVSWLDAEMTQDIGAASAALFNQLATLNYNVVDWSEVDQHRLVLITTLETARITAEQMVATLAGLDNEAQIFELLVWLFQGRSQFSTLWYDVVQRIFTADILDSLSKYPRCYGELVIYAGMLITHNQQQCPPALRTTLRSFLLDVPRGEREAELIESKANALAYLLRTGMKLTVADQWLRHLVKAPNIELSTTRMALRAFILPWRQYTSDVRTSLSATLTWIAKRPKYSKLWEFTRLARDQQSPSQLSN